MRGADSRRRTVDGGQRTVDSRRRTVDGGQRTADSRRQMRYFSSLCTMHYALCTLLLLFAPLSATNPNASTAGFAFLKMNYSARALGMANAFTALSDDADGVFFNPAGTFQCEEIQLKTSYMSYIEGMQGGSLTYLTTYDGYRIAPWTQFMFSGDIDKKDEFNVSQGTFTTSDLVIGLAIANTVHEALDLGVNIKYFYESLDTSSASAILGDFSLLHTTNNPNLKIGATLKNVGAQLTYYTEEKHKEKMPMMGVGGASLKIPDRAFINLDVVAPFDNDVYFKVGTEVYITEMFTVRAGVDSRMKDYKTSEDMDWMAGLAFGLGFKWNDYMLDYAVSSMGGLGYVNQLSLSYRFR